MSRSLLVIAFAQALGREPSPEEKAAYLAALAEVAGGEYLYVPKLPQTEASDEEICRLRDGGMGYREIALELHCSQATIARALRQRSLLSISPYAGSAEAA